jgi:phenylpropionate dioxygenase-like ring-hydroxylating dioxygenase large terminal subunit
MLTQEENDVLTRVSPGTPAGELLRRYWQPAALSEELPPGGAPLAVKLLGEELVLFRDDQGQPGLLDIHCPHRGADLSYGRLEDGGIRCIYHGWLFDIHGRCLDMPGEPDGGRGHRDSVRLRSYPCLEKGELIFAYLGPGESPLFPAYEIFSVPEGNRFVSKVSSECNYLQGNEGNIDPVHLSFLHRIMDEDLARGGRPERYRKVQGSDISPVRLLGETVAPSIEVEVKDFGLRIYTWRKIQNDKAYLRVSNFVMPNLSAVPGETQGGGYLMNWHVPIDDEHHWKYMIVFSREMPLDQEKFRRRYEAEVGPRYYPARTKANRYLQDRQEMKSKTYSGLGSFFAAHDLYATETQGPIQDRTRENLVSSDKAIVGARKLLIKGIQDVQEGRDPLHVVRDPQSNCFQHMAVLSEVLSSSIDWKEHTRKAEAELRA